MWLGRLKKVKAQRRSKKEEEKADKVTAFISERYHCFGNVPLVEPVQLRTALPSSATRGHDGS